MSEHGPVSDVESIYDDADTSSGRSAIRIASVAALGGFGLPHDFRTRVLGFSGCFLGVVVEVEDLLRGVVPQP